MSAIILSKKNRNYWRLGKKQIDNLKALKPNTRELSIKDLISENELNPENVNDLKRNEKNGWKHL